MSRDESRCDGRESRGIKRMIEGEGREASNADVAGDRDEEVNNKDSVKEQERR